MGGTRLPIESTSPMGDVQQLMGQRHDAAPLWRSESQQKCYWGGAKPGFPHPTRSGVGLMLITGYKPSPHSQRGDPNVGLVDIHPPSSGWPVCAYWAHTGNARYDLLRLPQGPDANRSARKTLH